MNHSRLTRALSAVALLVAAAPIQAADNGKVTFQAKPAADYPHRQTSENVTIAADPFITDEQAKDAFGKINPFRLGVLPILIVVENKGKDALRVDHLKFVYTLPDNTHIEATPAADIRFLDGAAKPKTVPGPLGGTKVSKNKNPLSEWEIEGRAFTAKMIPPGQTASGFVYFQTSEPSAAASVNISGLVNAATGKELFYFDIPMSGN
ncbi:MAG TPA: hypothetical protein VKB79_19190 [Bryobacteraceae bacterium]|nr:hypothetical protein [Bryobacteraceae bacterium]